jgi:hypothetical protein
MACAAPTITVGGVTISTSDFVNAQELLKESDDSGDPTADAENESIANGNNTASAGGVQIPPPTQTTAPPDIPQAASASNDKPPPGGDGVPVICSPWVGDYNQVLSPNFTVKDFTVGALYPHQVTVFPPLSASQRVCNLQALAVNVAEPMRAKFGPFRINSGLRNTNSTSSGLSQHVSGQAMDIQFIGWTYARYWENAAWIKDNIKYDQFIFEHSSKTGLAWYHLTYNQAGNRASTVRTKVMTMYRNNYSPGLKRYG